jgi:hypothetical protein
VRNPSRNWFKFALRFTAYGERRYVTLGSPEEGWSQARAEADLENVLADVRRGIWKPHLVELPAEPEGPRKDPTFHEFATKRFASISKEIRPSMRLDYE